MDSIYPLGETPSYTAALYKLLCQIPFYLKKKIIIGEKAQSLLPYN